MLRDAQSLQPCKGIWGESHLMYGDPSLQRVEQAIFLPFRQNGSWGLYDRNLQPVMEAVDRRGGDRIPHHAIEWDIKEPVKRDPTGDIYLYCGRLNPHYGHFIINSLPKFWPFASAAKAPKLKLLCAERPDHLQSFTLDILGQIGIGLNDLCWFDRPTQIAAAIVPSPSVLEQYWAYTIYKDLCERIGSPWWSEIDSQLTPAYLSKAKLSTGVGRFSDEPIIEAVMRQAGVDIFHPQEMPVQAQVQLMSRRRICIGPAGSAFHTTMFAPRHRQFVCFNPADRVNSNFDLLDKLNNNKSTYLYQPNMQYESYDGGFLTTVRLSDPKRLAYELLDEVEQQVPWRRRA